MWRMRWARRREHASYIRLCKAGDEREAGCDTELIYIRVSGVAAVQQVATTRFDIGMGLANE